jgi:hypothetical protein
LWIAWDHFSFALSGLDLVSIGTHSSRRGLQSSAATRLPLRYCTIEIWTGSVEVGAIHIVGSFSFLSKGHPSQEMDFFLWKSTKSQRRRPSFSATLDIGIGAFGEIDGS